MLTTSQQKLVVNTLAVVGAIHTYKVAKTRLYVYKHKLTTK